MASFESIYQAAVDNGEIRGALLFARDVSGEFNYTKIFGERTLLSGENKLHQTSDILAVASATKLLTAIAALQCVEDGLLSLSADVASIAPVLTGKQAITGHDGDKFAYEPQSPITLERLLTHSSGIGYAFLGPKLINGRRKTARNLPRGRHGKGLNDFMHERIFAPLGIKDANLFPVTREDMRAMMVNLNPTDPEGRGLVVSGGLESSTRTLLKPETVNEMFQPHLGPGPEASMQEVMSGPATNPFYVQGTEPDVKRNHGLAGSNTLAWGGGLNLIWFIDRGNGLCALGAPQLGLPINYEAAARLKHIFRRGIYDMYNEWKGSEDR
ncbi:beta-lactamase/transpeptidase-like protein [Clohesyomyces aquaticus]|uniref:Beta-lactamase/transpeptidase-like protein n=1 Tax=Clohesyomyces aquaticus TaxID=1231657 RepID=A0A1Y1ZHX6_9PLEO|nr:beta-lactamase/transpeptidase-like protein [Clohesyomyces aquaticus]